MPREIGLAQSIPLTNEAGTMLNRPIGLIAPQPASIGTNDQIVFQSPLVIRLFTANVPIAVAHWRPSDPDPFLLDPLVGGSEPSCVKSLFRYQCGQKPILLVTL